MAIITRGGDKGLKAASREPVKGPVQESFERGMTYYENQERDGGRLYVSSAFFCERMETWKTAPGGTLYEQTPHMKIYQEAGNAIETALQEGWFNDGSLLFANCKTPDVAINLGGEIDAVLYLEELGHIVIVEVKSCSKLPAAPKPRHRAQALGYSSIVGLPAIIVYQERGVASWKWGNPLLQQKEFTLPFTRAQLAPGVKRAILSHLYTQNEFDPPRPKGFRKTIECKFCDFKKGCWGGEPHAWLATPTAEELGAINQEAEAMLEEWFKQLPKRRNGFLKHIATNGTKHAQALLNGKAWEPLIAGLGNV